MKAVVLGTILAASIATWSLAAIADDPTPPAPWSPHEAKQLLERVIKREPFLSSAEARRDRSTLDRFFHAEDYAVLRGNPVLGYWDAGRFRWRGARVAWDGVVAAAPSARPITRRAWDAAFEHVARKQGLTIDARAQIRIRGACVAAVMNPTVASPNRGVLLEVRWIGRTGADFRLAPIRRVRAFCPLPHLAPCRAKTRTLAQRFLGPISDVGRIPAFPASSFFGKGRSVRR